MPAMVQIEARTPYRVRVVWDAPAGGLAAAADYALRRADGAGAGPVVAAAWAVDATAVELALDAPLHPGLDLVVSHANGASAPLALPPAPAQEGSPAEASDPEAELFGVDVDWLGGALAPGGDLPEIRGLAALKADLAAIAVTAPGELFHRPDEGAALPLRVNGPNVAAELGAIEARVRRTWGADDRVRQARALARAATDGTVTVQGDVETVPLPDERLGVTVRR